MENAKTSRFLLKAINKLIYVSLREKIINYIIFNSYWSISEVSQRISSTVTGYDYKEFFMVKMSNMKGKFEHKT